jgi:hypothetical protein
MATIGRQSVVCGHFRYLSFYIISRRSRRVGTAVGQNTIIIENRRFRRTKWKTLGALYKYALRTQSRVELQVKVDSGHSIPSGTEVNGR